MIPKPLDGIRVLDFSHALAGPYCTMLMSAYGATVYKIEGTAAMDMGRTWGPPFQGGEASYFIGINSGKQAVAVNLKHPEGLELCRRMAEQADVLVENFRPGAMARLGMGYESIKARNQRLIYCSISGYGQNGPRRDDPAMDLILQASSGLISVTGTADGRVARCGHSVADITAGMFALIGVLLAMRVREQTGQGQFVDVSMLDSMISAMASNFANLLGSGIVPGPMGTGFATIVPYATFPTKDREIAIAVASEKLWGIFCDSIGKPEWTADPRFTTNPLRVANRGILEPMIVELFRTRTAEEWTTHFRETGIPCTPVRSLDEVVADPQAASRRMFVDLPHPTAGSVKVTGAPIKFSQSEGKVDSAAPLQAQHTRQALEDLLSMSESDIDALIARGVVKQAE